MMTIDRLAGAVVAALAIVASIEPAFAAPAPAQFLRGKFTAGATFMEEATWDSSSAGAPDIDKGHSKTTLHSSFSEDVQIIVQSGVVTVASVPKHVPSSKVSADFSSTGSSSVRGGSEYDHTGTITLGGGPGTATAAVADDFNANGDGLSFELGYYEPLSGGCRDTKYADKCSLNAAYLGMPQIMSGGGMNLNGGGMFIGLKSSRTADSSPTSHDWKGVVCSGNPHLGWTCGFTGRREWNKTPGTNNTQSVQMNAKISIVGSGRW